MKPEALRGALERFAQFFIAPLCKADALEREVNAVHNEFTGARAPTAGCLSACMHEPAQPHLGVCVLATN